MSELIDRAMNVAIVQYKDMNETLRQNAFPKTTAPDGSLETSGKYWWCSGFYPGTCGICMSILWIRVFGTWQRSIPKC